MPSTQEITNKFVIVGEGAGDAKFFEHLCAVQAIPGFQFLHAGGVGKFEQYLTDLPSLSGFTRHCKALIVVGDNDDTPDENFKFIRVAVKRASSHLSRRSPPISLPVPDLPFQIAKHANSDLRVVILMLPFEANEQRRRGCLETLLLQSATAKNPTIAACIPNFSDCVGVGGWTNGSHVDKFQLRALLAAANPDDPNFSLVYALNPTFDLIPLNHASFDPIVAFLKSLSQKIL